MISMSRCRECRNPCPAEFVLVDHPEMAESHVLGVVVIAKEKLW